VGIHRFGVSTSGVQPVAMVRRTHGIGIDINRHTIAIMLGFSEDAIFSKSTTDEPVIRHLVLTPDEPSKIELHQIRQQDSCD
jgi:hypothetical protein